MLYYKLIHAYFDCYYYVLNEDVKIEIFTSDIMETYSGKLILSSV